MSAIDESFGPNVTQILVQATRVVRGRVPREVRAELMAAVKAGVLGRFAKDGLKPEIFFHPDHRNGAIDRQNREAAYAIGCISTVMANGAERAEYDAELMARAAKATHSTEA